MTGIHLVFACYAIAVAVYLHWRLCIVESPRYILDNPELMRQIRAAASDAAEICIDAATCSREQTQIVAALIESLVDRGLLKDKELPR